MMVDSEKMVSILNQLHEQLEELQKRIVSKINEAKGVISTAVDDTKALPGYIQELKERLDELVKNNVEIEDKIKGIKEEIEKVKEEIKLKEQKKDELEKTEMEKRAYKEDIEKEIAELTNKKQSLEVEIEEKSKLLSEKEKEYTQVQLETKELLAKADGDIVQAKEELEAAKDQNKILVYLLESGLLDAPEAEIVSVIASYPEGLKIEEIKEKVKIPPVRVQPTINNLLEKVIIFDPHKEVYKIAETVIEELQ